MLPYICIFLYIHLCLIRRLSRRLVTNVLQNVPAGSERVPGVPAVADDDAQSDHPQLAVRTRGRTRGRRADPQFRPP
jgi:hypothetical protein